VGWGCFLRLGHNGYRRIQSYSPDAATTLAGHITELESFRIITDSSQLPVFPLTLANDEHGYSVFDVSAAPAPAGLARPRLHLARPPRAHRPQQLQLRVLASLESRWPQRLSSAMSGRTSTIRPSLRRPRT